MSEPLAGARGAPDLRAFLLDPASAAVPEARRITPNVLRLCIGALDALQVIFVGQFAARLFPSTAQTVQVPQALGLGVVAALIAIAIRHALRAGSERMSISDNADWSAPRAALAAVLAIGAVGAVHVLAAPAGSAVMFDEISGWILAWALGAAVVAAMLRQISAYTLSALADGQRIVVVGAPEQTEALDAAASEVPRAGWRLMGRVNDRDAAGLDRLSALLKQQGADVVALAMAGPGAKERIAAICDRIADQPVRVCMVFDTTTLAPSPRGLNRIGRFVLVDLTADPHGGLGGLVKRMVDVLGAGLVLLVLAPVMAVVALAIRLESPGPVLFRQWRFGKGSRPFVMVKFRSMRTGDCDSTGERRTVARDPRVTRVGRFLRRTSLDELPQLLNVLRGDMSLVGPRAHPLHMRVGGRYYFEVVERYRVRHVVKPGITGWAQINGSRGEVDTLEKARRRLELDLWYVENWSHALDFRILLRTAIGGFFSPRAD